MDPAPETQALLAQVERQKQSSSFSAVQDDIRAISKRIATLQGVLNDTLQELRSLTDQLTDA